MISECGNKHEKALNNIYKQKIFLDKIKRTGSNLKKKGILQGLYSSLHSTSHL